MTSHRSRSLCADLGEALAGHEPKKGSRRETVSVSVYDVTRGVSVYLGGGKAQVLPVP